MKVRRNVRFLPLLVTLACSGVVSHSNGATDQYWNVGGTGGDGIWGTGPGDKNWNLVAGAAVGNTTWPDSGNDVAVFQDAIGGTVTVFDPVLAAGLSQTGADYTLNAGTITLVPDSVAAAPFIHVQAGTLTVNTTIEGSDGLLKTGGGTLLLATSNNYTGTTTVSAGSINLTGSLASTTLAIASGSSLTDAAGGLAAATVVTNAGTLAINAAETIASLTNNAGTVNGTGTLTVTGATIFTGGTLAAPLTLNGLGGGTFTNGSLAGTFIGTAALDGATVSGTVSGNTTSNGNTLVSGSLGGGSLGVTGGVLTLTGISTNPTVTLAAGSGLLDQTGGLAAAAGLTNHGTLTVNAADTIASYIQSSTGSLTGSGVLTASGGATLSGGTVSGNLRGNTFCTGDLLVSGSIGGGTLDVTGGTLNLTGASTNTPINIAAAGKLIDANGGLDSSARLVNRGYLTITTADAIKYYTQMDTGLLTGPGVLTALSIELGGGTVEGNLRGGYITTKSVTVGDVLVSGTIGGGELVVYDRTLTLSGTSSNSLIDIAYQGRLVDVNGGLDSAAVVENVGVLNIGASETVATYTQSLIGSLEGTGTLTATGGAFLNGGLIGGNLRGDITVTRDVNVSGSIGGGTLDINGGTLSLGGTSTNTRINIATAGSLSVSKRGLDPTAFITNAGDLYVNGNSGHDTIASYISNGGTMGGGLTATTAVLNDGSSIAGFLEATSVTTNGAVSIFGGLTADTLNINSGILTTTRPLPNVGSLSVTTRLNITSGATLVATGIQTYPLLLTTSGPGAGAWQGDLSNPSTVAPGGVGVIGTLAVTGDFSNTHGGTLKLDVGTGVRDLVTVGGTATFGGTLDLGQLSPITPFVPVQVVAAGDYSGSFSSLTENLDGAVWFNPNNGTVMALAPPDSSEGTLWGTTANQTSVWISLYDDVIAPGTTNVVQRPGGYDITSGPADANNPDLLNALSASFVPGGLNGAVLDRLSPEVYAGFQDYAIQATRSHQRAALDAPSLGFIQAPPCPHPTGSKNALSVPAATNPWEYFATIDFFDAATDSSPNHADYDLNSFGFVAGARTSFSERIRAGGYFAADTGSVDGTLINADATGWSLGVFAKALLDERTHTLVSGGISYGKYEFDGTRGSIVATGGGWTPANTGFSGVDGDALEFYLGASSLAYHSERFRLIPSIGLRFVCGNMEGFAETAGLPGAPIALAVDGDAYHSALAEVSLRAEADLTDIITLHGMIGFSAGINDAPAALTARFATGARPLRVTAAGLDEDAISIGLGATWRVRDNLGLGLDWRADFRSDADMENTLGVSTSIRF